MPIFVGIGSNLSSPQWGTPVSIIAAAIDQLPRWGVIVSVRSRLWQSSPLHVTNQPDFFNAVLQVSSDLSPLALLAALKDCESFFGRTAGVRFGPRVLDLDLLDFHGRVIPDVGWPDGQLPLILPHPRLHQRLFALGPLQELMPTWHHSVLNQSIGDLIQNLPGLQMAVPIEEGSP